MNIVFVGESMTAFNAWGLWMTGQSPNSKSKYDTDEKNHDNEKEFGSQGITSCLVDFVMPYQPIGITPLFDCADLFLII